MRTNRPLQFFDMKNLYTVLFLSLIIFASCKSPEEKLENLVNDFRQNVCTGDYDQTSEMATASMDSLLKNYRQVCRRVSNDQDLLTREKVNLSKVEIQNDKARAMINDDYPVHFVKEDNKWKISSYPDFQARLTAVTYLYALDEGNYALARQLSTPQSHEVIDLMQQFDHMSGDTARTDTVKISIKVDEVVLKDNGAEVHYKDDNMKELLQVVNTNEGAWQVELRSESVPQDSI